MSGLEIAIEALIEEWNRLNVAIEPESIIQICEFMGEYQKGVDIYKMISMPSALDERWVGQCYVAIGERERGREHYLKSVEMGSELAIIDLAFTTSLLGNGRKAILELENVKREHLNKYNLALWYRVAGFVNICHFDKKQGRDLMYKAWQYVQGTQEFAFLAPKILMHLAGVEKDLGNRRKSLYYLQRAEEICKTKFIWNVLFLKSIMLYETGKYLEAKKYFLEVINFSEISVQVAVSLDYLAKMCFFEGKIQDALNYYERVIIYTEEKMITTVGAFTGAFLSSIYAHLRNEYKTRYYLNYARNNATSSDHKREILLRELYASSIFNWEYADYLKEVNIIENEYRENGNILESIRARIYGCYFSYLINDEGFKEKVSKLIIDIIESDCLFILYEERIFVKQLSDYINNFYDDMIQFNKPKTIMIKVIDREEITIDDKYISIPLRKTLEVLLFMRIYGPSSLKDLIYNVFQDHNYQKAKTYFHQIKHLINDRLDCMRIYYDKDTKKYSLEPVEGFRIITDIDNLLNQNGKTTGVILPSSGSDWVIELNQRLSE